MTTVVVGAGIAGLLCARELARAGRPVTVLEREPAPGGRVRSRMVDGYVIDRGFQVLFTAYPTLRAALDLDGAGGARLALRSFAPAARLASARHAGIVGDALRAPGLLLPTLASRALPIADLLRLAALRRLARTLSVEECFAPAYDARPAHDFLRARGFSRAAIENFFAPFYGGILLDPTLGTAASVLLFTFKMLAEGDTVVPAQGMGAIARVLADALPAGTVRTNATVDAIDVVDGRAAGVRLAGGETLAASAVVLATEGPAAAALARNAGVALAGPDLGTPLGCTTLYVASTDPTLPGRAIWLAPRPEATFAHAVTLTDVAPEYAAADARHGRHLLALTAVGAHARLDDDALLRAARAQVAAMRAAAGMRQPLAADALAPVAVERVPWSQYPQPPGAAARRAVAATALPGLWRASEAAHTSSLEGAARGGVLAARAILAAR
ncbi:MAG: FAD-dependent oxidoreductase [Gemmatirosa sp.]